MECTRVFSQSFGNEALFIKHDDEGQLVVESEIEVELVVCRSDLDSACAKGSVDPSVGDDRDQSTIGHEWVAQALSVQHSVARVLWMHCHCCVSQHRLWASRADHYLPTPVGQRVCKRP